MADSQAPSQTYWVRTCVLKQCPVVCTHGKVCNTRPSMLLGSSGTLCRTTTPGCRASHGTSRSFPFPEMESLINDPNRILKIVLRSVSPHIGSFLFLQLIYFPRHCLLPWTPSVYTYHLFRTETSLLIWYRSLHTARTNSFTLMTSLLQFRAHFSFSLLSSLQMFSACFTILFLLSKTKNVLNIWKTWISEKHQANNPPKWLNKHLTRFSISDRGSLTEIVCTC